MIRVCVVKQNTTYDLFTRTGPDLRSIVASSNLRSGPLGLWEAFDCSARVVWEDAARECQTGRQYWDQYVQGWDVWPADGRADLSDDVDWTQYDVVISVDVAVPERIVRRFPGVMWCYYFIEGGPWGIDRQFKGSPCFGYNVFFNHRLAKVALTPQSSSVRRMRATRRAVLDFPYYMQSARSIRELYDDWSDEARHGICLGHHSRDVISTDELKALEEFGPVRREWSTLADIHRAELASAYFVVHPLSTARTGTAVIEAISAGCLVLAPSRAVSGFPELLRPMLDFETFEDLCSILRELEADSDSYRHHRAVQARLVDEWCYLNPAMNLVTIFEAFGMSSASRSTQSHAEWLDRAGATGQRAVRAWGHRARAAALRACARPVLSQGHR